MSQDDIITYTGDLPNPDIPTEQWHNMTQTVFLLIVGGPWDDIAANVRAAIEDNPDHKSVMEQVAETAEMLGIVQKMIHDEYRHTPSELEKLEQMKNFVSRNGPIRVLELFW